jgi:uncharacterized protein with HEPN domain
MKHPERVEDYLEHIAEAIERATGYLQPVPDLAAFKKEPAGSRCGCPQYRDHRRGREQDQQHRAGLHQTASRASMGANGGMRNVAIHEYFFVDLEIVWTTVKDDLPKLKQQVDALLKP